MRHLIVLLPTLLLPLSAGAQSRSTVVDLTYSGYSSAFHVLTMQSEIELTPSGYRITIAGHTAGMVGFLYHARWRTWADGLWNGDGVESLQFDNDGVFGGDPRHVALAFDHGDAKIRVLQPPNDGEHTPVPPAMQRHVIDSLSITAMIVHQLATLGHCQGRTTAFDGRQVEAVTLQADGTEVLPRTDRSSWSGPTLRCAIETRVLAGFYHSEESDPMRIRNDIVWLGNVLPDAPPLPVRMTASVHHLGHIVLYLTDARLRGHGTQTAKQP
jgi:hypothetical protein